MAPHNSSINLFIYICIKCHNHDMTRRGLAWRNMYKGQNRCLILNLLVTTNHYSNAEC